jgi:aryl-phospho-beta-D-glucosidase BglC (GH1 family)
MTTTAPPPVPIPFPTPLECFRYRYHHGCNLGSVYVTEKWITPSTFPPNATEGQTSELAAVSLNVNQFGIDATRTKFEARWKGIMTDADWNWLCTEAKCRLLTVASGCTN